MGEGGDARFERDFGHKPETRTKVITKVIKIAEKEKDTPDDAILRRARKETADEIKLDRARNKAKKAEQRAEEAENDQFKMAQETWGAYQDRDEMEKEATIDPLTGLPNRRALKAELTTATDQATRRRIDGLKQQKIYGIMMDLDHFKVLNEAVGHPVADEILKTMWVINNSESRAGEDIHRYGGEEFFKLLHDIDEADIPMITERINERMRSLSKLILVVADHLNTDYKKPEFAQFSFGVAELQPGDTPETFMKRADAALNKVKQTGRGATLIAESDENGNVTQIRQPGIPASPGSMAA